MKILKLKYAVAAMILAGAAPAYANLVQVAGTQVSGTGLGSVSTLVTVQDNNLPSRSGKSNGIESGCVSYAGSLASPSFACQLGLEGGDNQAINNLFLASTIDGLTSAGQLAVVVNISEKTPSETALLTNLYLSLYNLDTSAQMNFSYAGSPLELGDSGGIGQSGKNLFVLDTAQAGMANSFCPDLTQCVIGGGLQFGFGTTSATPDTMYVAALTDTSDSGGLGGGEGGPVDTGDSGGATGSGGTPAPLPEPLSLALVGLGLAGMRAARRKTR